MKMARTMAVFSAVSAFALIMASDSIATDESALWPALAEGGKVVMIRHTQSEDASPEVSMYLSAGVDCAQEQKLSKEGREQARALGARFREPGVKVDAAISSEFRRARETAVVAFGDFEA